MIVNNWFLEEGLSLSVALELDNCLESKQSKYQQIDIYKTKAMGNLMLLDKKVMVTDKDEFYYHETISHSVLSMISNPQKVMVIGGGDGGTVREVLKYKSIQEVELVEIDEDVIELSKKYFPETASELNNPKLKIKVNDAIEYVKNAKENEYDAILCDSTDPEGFAAGLISKDFYKSANKSLKKDGIYICQSGSLIVQEKEFTMALENMRTAFKHVDAIVSIIPTYPGSLWSFLMGSNNPIEKKIKTMPLGKTKYWSEEIQEKLFAKPNWLKEKYFQLQTTI